MEIATTPDTYAPSVNNAGDYIDNVPTIKNGLCCPCGSRKDKFYETASKFVAHTKTKTHQSWLTQMNQNKANYYVEMTKYKELVENQRKIISRLENQLQKKTLTVEYLTDQLVSNQYRPTTTNINLLDL